jgi:ribosome-binding protein aMBF1 (putative translation factor)
MKKICPICGKEFDGSKQKIYCSETCYQKAYFLRRKVKQTVKHLTVCRWCFKKFATKTNPPRFCSQECKTNYNRVRCRIINEFSRNGRDYLDELLELERLGCNYSFPVEFDDCNHMYNLKTHMPYEKREIIRDEDEWNEND